MARVFITGSADGLGQLAARRLVGLGHDVVLHGRTRQRAEQALRAVTGARTALAGDLASIEATRDLGRQANATGPFQAVIHNAGVYRPSAARRETVDGLDDVFAINALAPYLLTALIEGPQRLIYISSGMQESGDPNLREPQQRRQRWTGIQAYADSKLFDVVLAFAVARLWPGVASNAVDPGWVPTKMGGPLASDDLEQGAATQVWLAVGEDRDATLTGRYLYHMQPQAAHPAASDVDVQNAFLATCAQLTGVQLRSFVAN